MSNPSLFEKIGKMPAVNAAVDIFYKKVIADPDLKGFFEHVDLEKQAGKMKTFLAYAFGGPLNYDGKSMRDAHAHMDIKEKHFGLVAGHLSDTLKELGVDQALIDEVISIAASTHDDIVKP